ncbi:AMP-binding enzyme [Haladaptatus halobius]|uniref:AMP-binding enzyme n=1 Tax=Haladaptatus halobius TaxID=2884875 RepID=UPI0034A5B1B2
MTERSALFLHRLEDMFTTGCADVYPREIEETLYEIDQITGAAVIDTRDDLRSAVVTAVITQSSDNLTADQIRRICDDRLASHEVPQRIEFVNKIPTTAIGKVDRVALRERFGTPSPYPPSIRHFPTNNRHCSVCSNTSDSDSPRVSAILRTRSKISVTIVKGIDHTS